MLLSIAKASTCQTIKSSYLHFFTTGWFWISLVIFIAILILMRNSEYRIWIGVGTGFALLVSGVVFSPGIGCSPFAVGVVFVLALLGVWLGWLFKP